jgi:hypothetical protein
VGVRTSARGARFCCPAPADAAGLEEPARLGIERSYGNVLGANASEVLDAVGEWDRAATVAQRALALEDVPLAVELRDGDPVSDYLRRVVRRPPEPRSRWACEASR